MLRKRERFERSDVPRATPLRTVISLLVVIGLVGGIYLLLTTLWRRANQVNGFGDRALRSSVRSQATVANPAEGYIVSDHEFYTVLVFTTEGGTLSHAQILSIDQTESRGILASLPLNTRVTSKEEMLQLGDLYVRQGASACVGAVAAAANIKLSHVMVAHDGIWDQIEQLRGGRGIADLLGSTADILETINTDMSTDDLFKLVEMVRGIGMGNFNRIDVPVIQEQLENGMDVSVIDQTQLGVQLGMLIAPVPTEGEGEEA